MKKSTAYNERFGVMWKKGYTKMTDKLKKYENSKNDI